VKTANFCLIFPIFVISLSLSLSLSPVEYLNMAKTCHTLALVNFKYSYNPKNNEKRRESQKKLEIYLKKK